MPNARGALRSALVLSLTLTIVLGVTALPAHASTVFDVSNTNDSGDGSLRQAILDANATEGADEIDFTFDTSDQVTITPASALPDITGTVFIYGATVGSGVPQIVLDGSNLGANDAILNFQPGSDSSTVEDLALVNSGGAGVRIQGASYVSLSYDWIGTADGSTPAGNATGVLIGGGGENDVNGTDIEYNVISGNSGDGIAVTSFNGTSQTNSATIANNAIGVGSDWASPLGNGGDGVALDDYAQDSTVGGTGGELAAPATSTDAPTPNLSASGNGNVIAYNTGDGISAGSGSQGDVFSENAIGGNGGSGISLGEGANGGIQTPTLTSWDGVTLTGSVPGSSNESFTLELFDNASCSTAQGESFYDWESITTDGSGNFSTSAFLDGASFVTATVTGVSGTSELSNCLDLSGGSNTQPNPPTNVSATAGDGDALVTWSPPDGGPAVDSYTLTVHSSDEGAAIPGPFTGITDTSFLVTGLTNGATYTFTVQSVSGEVSSDPSDPSNPVTPSKDSSVQELSGADSMTTGTGTPSSTDPMVGQQQGTFQPGTIGVLDELFATPTTAAPIRAAVDESGVDPNAFCGTRGCAAGEVLVNKLSKSSIGRYNVKLLFFKTVAPRDPQAYDVFFDPTPSTSGDVSQLRSCPSRLASSSVAACVKRIVEHRYRRVAVKVIVSVRSDVIDPATALRK